MSTGMTISGRAMARVVNSRPLTMETWVWVQASPCGICGGKSGA